MEHFLGLISKVINQYFIKDKFLLAERIIGQEYSIFWFLHFFKEDNFLTFDGRSCGKNVTDSLLKLINLNLVG